MQPHFDGRALLEPLPDGANFRVVEEFAYHVNEEFKVTVPAGTITDLASIPPLGTIGAAIMAAAQLAGYAVPEIGFAFWLGFAVSILGILLPRNGPWTPAAIVHDRLYSRHTMSRPVADGILFDAMGILPVAPWKRAAIYYGVRLGGFAPFYRKRKDVETKRASV